MPVTVVADPMDTLIIGLTANPHIVPVGLDPLFKQMIWLKQMTFFAIQARGTFCTRLNSYPGPGLSRGSPRYHPGYWVQYAG